MPISVDATIACDAAGNKRRSSKQVSPTSRGWLTSLAARAAKLLEASTPQPAASATDVAELLPSYPTIAPLREAPSGRMSPHLSLEVAAEEELLPCYPTISPSREETVDFSQRAAEERRQRQRAQSERRRWAEQVAAEQDAAMADLEVIERAIEQERAVTAEKRAAEKEAAERAAAEAEAAAAAEAEIVAARRAEAAAEIAAAHRASAERAAAERAAEEQAAAERAAAQRAAAEQWAARMQYEAMQRYAVASPPFSSMQFPPASVRGLPYPVGEERAFEQHEEVGIARRRLADAAVRGDVRSLRTREREETNKLFGHLMRVLMPE